MANLKLKGLGSFDLGAGTFEFSIELPFGDGGAAPFDPVEELFGSSENGGLYLPGDTSSLWQDTGRTTPVTTPGQSVKVMDDLSGNGLHLTSDLTADPTYQVDSGGKGYLSYPDNGNVRMRQAVTAIDPLGDIHTGAMVKSGVWTAGNDTFFGVSNGTNRNAGSLRFRAATANEFIYLIFQQGSTVPDTAWPAWDRATPTNYACQGWKPSFADGVGTSDAWLRVNGTEEGVTILDTGTQIDDISLGGVTDCAALRFYGGFVRQAGLLSDLAAVDTWLESLAGE